MINTKRNADTLSHIVPSYPNLFIQSIQAYSLRHLHDNNRTFLNWITMSTIDEKRAAFHQYLASSGVISALSKALIKLYEEPNKPDDPVNFVRRHMGSEDFFILGDGKVQNAEEEELVLSSLIEKKSEDTVVGDVGVENVLPDNNQNVNEVNEETDDKQTDDAEAANADPVEGTEDADGVVDGTEKLDEVVEEQEKSDDVVETTEEAGETTGQEVDQLNSDFEKLKSNEDCNSILKTHLTDEIFEKLKNVNTDGGTTLYDCIKSGLENQDSVLGIYAGTNLQSYDQFSDIFDPVIEAYHGFGIESVQPDSDCGDSETFQKFNGNDDFVVSIRINCVRNMQEYPVVSKMEENDFNDSLAKIKAITEVFDDSSKGTLYVMSDLTDDQETELKSVGGLMENTDKHLSSANVYQQWPVGRGVFLTDDKSIIIQINGEDHLKFMSTESDKNFGKIYQRLVDTVSLFELPFSRHDRLGWLTFSPSNLGAALHFTIELKLPKLQSNPDKLQEIIASSPIKIKLSESEAEGTYTLCNQSTMGYSEFDLAKQFYEVVQAIIECESSLE